MRFKIKITWLKTIHSIYFVWFNHWRTLSRYYILNSTFKLIIHYTINIHFKFWTTDLATSIFKHFSPLVFILKCSWSQHRVFVCAQACSDLVWLLIALGNNIYFIMLTALTFVSFPRHVLRVMLAAGGEGRTLVFTSLQTFDVLTKTLAHLASHCSFVLCFFFSFYIFLSSVKLVESLPFLIVDVRQLVRFVDGQETLDRSQTNDSYQSTIRYLQITTELFGPWYRLRHQWEVSD